jgi:putative tryptophan/tyrosine transport system permease protein
MNLAVGALAIGLLISLLALGVFVALRVLHRTDLTADGAFGVGAAVAAAALVRGLSPWTTTLLGLVAGSLAGVTTGLIHTRLRTDMLLAGILTSTALYSVILYVMGGGDLSIVAQPTVFSIAESVWHRTVGDAPDVEIFGTTVTAANCAALALLVVVVSIAAVTLDWLLRTRFGLAMRATGDNAPMARAQGVAVDGMVVLGLALANALAGFSGALFAQYQGFSNVQMGLGMLVTGLACVVLGEALFGRRRVRTHIAGVAAGAVLYRLLVAAALRLGLDPNALKLVTAVFVLAALVLPGVVRRGLARPWARTGPRGV